MFRTLHPCNDTLKSNNETHVIKNDYTTKSLNFVGFLTALPERVVGIPGCTLSVGTDCCLSSCVVGVTCTTRSACVGNYTLLCAFLIG